jgi:Txe/YoeB family toxin of Txe-Axe toxin-antitoxin module
MTGNFNYLQKSFALFPKLTGIMFGFEYDMERIEDKVSHVKEKDRLERKDLSTIYDAEEWNYNKFWPDLSTSTKFKQPVTGIFNLGWEKRRKTISELYKRFRHIEVVSVILRFVDPDNFAIISPPVEKFFSLQPKDNHVEYYLNYLDLLRKTARHFKRPGRIADVDMAIWTLTYLIKNWDNEEFRSKWDNQEKYKIGLIVHSYKNNLFFKKIRLQEALKQLYQDIEDGWSEPNRITLADCLDSEMVDPDLAMIIVAYSFENLLWELVLETGKEEEFIDIWSRVEWINKLKGVKIFKSFPIFRKCVDFRNRAVHPWLPRLSPVEREDFIYKLEKLIRMKKSNNL